MNNKNVIYQHKESNKQYTIKESKYDVLVENKINKFYTLIDINTLNELTISEEELQKFYNKRIILD